MRYENIMDKVRATVNSATDIFGDERQVCGIDVIVTLIGKKFEIWACSPLDKLAAGLAAAICDGLEDTGLVAIDELRKSPKILNIQGALADEITPKEFSTAVFAEIHRLAQLFGV